MKRIITITLNLALPLAVILFGTITKWRYVYVEDGPDDFLYGFPLSFICSGWHTSLSLQIFISELLIDFLVYLIICLAVLLAIDKFLLTIKIGKKIKFLVYGFATVVLILYGIVFANPDNIFAFKRDFKYQEIRDGYKFVWQQDKR
jgi:hypothetical protein